MSPRPIGAPRGSETVLLMDTDPEIRKLAAFMLGKQGYTVLEARNRAEAISLLDGRSDDIELLLLEAKGRGYELAKELQQSQPQVPVLFLCSDSPRGSLSGLEPEAPFLKKPFTMHDIAGKVREALDSRNKTMAASGAA